MSFRVELTAQAKQDLNAILEWLREQGAGDAGLRWLFKLELAIASLSEHPQRCPLAPENKEFPFEVRQVLYGRKPGRYRVLFTIDGANVIVLHIRTAGAGILENSGNESRSTGGRNLCSGCCCNLPLEPWRRVLAAWAESAAG